MSEITDWLPEQNIPHSDEMLKQQLNKMILTQTN
jgi:hypothetical protein